MSNHNHKEVLREEAIKLARQEWYRRRADQVRNNITAYEVLRRNGVSLSGSDNSEEQISCPFHGVDRKPSARIYPDSADGPSHVWCFVCQETRWDAIGLWRKFNGGDEVPFGRVLSQMEKAYNLPTIDMPREISGKESSADQQAVEEFQALHEVCENRLRMSRSAYQKLSDLEGFLSASSLLDRILFRVMQRQITPARGRETLQQLLTKIREKVLMCPDG